MEQRTRYFSAPGRVEIGGNHTDHQRGRVLAAAIDLSITAAVRLNGSNILRFSSDFLPKQEVDLTDLSVRPDEKGTSMAMVRGVAAWFHERGYPYGGFDAEISSNIPTGTGLSSSAAFEVLIGTIFKGLFGANISAMEIAQAGQFAENVYFGKPCGLMDQAASSFGGLNVFDFKDPQKPLATPIDAKLSGYVMCVVDTGGSHADLTPDYAACTNEMKAVAAHFGKMYLREVSEDVFYASIRELRYLGDRAILRAIHFFDDHKRVEKQATALENGDSKRFLDLITESGRSSFALLQNVFSTANPQEQSLTLALTLSERILADKGAWRVHGGGFAGTILAFVPEELKEEYQRQMEAVFGENCCHFLNIRAAGGREEG